MKKIILFLLLTLSMFAQVSYEPVESPVYEFLDRQAAHGNVIINDVVRPLSREYILSKLLEIKENESRLSKIEKENLEFYLKEFYLERNDGVSSYNSSAPGSFFQDPLGRYRFYTYKDERFRFAVDPVLGMSAGYLKGSSHTWYRGGISFYGYLGKNIGFNFMFYDNTERGDSLDRYKSFSTERGINVTRNEPSEIQYSEARVNLTYSWSYGEISVGKDFLNWGHGESGLLVLSDKAPSFPFIRLDVHPAKWISFNYIHAWLKSDVLDSSATYPTYRVSQNRVQDKNKYFASHSFNIFPAQGLTISLGESIVYSDRLELLYLTPIMFFRLGDHFLSDNDNNKGSNSQYFMAVSSRNQLRNTHLYGTFFIDEIRLYTLFESQKQRNQFGFTLGGSVTDMPVNNLDFTLEYTKIYPYVYQHYIPTQTYESDSYSLGHWMGSNADLIYASLKYRFIRGLSAKAWIQHIRKGGEGDVEQQYTIPQPVFLSGLRKNYTNFGLDVTYQVTHNLFAKFNYSSWKNEYEGSEGTFTDDNYSSFCFRVDYGLR